MAKFQRVNFKRHTEFRLAGHEMFLSFFDDSGADAFDLWLYSEGLELFNKWLKTSSNYKHLAEED